MRVLATVGLLIALAVSGCFAGSGTAAGPPGVYVSTTGIDTNPGTQQLPVQSFNVAYRLAKTGGTVFVGAGDYPYQRLELDRTKGSKHVVFRPLPGQAVNVEQIDFGQAQLGIPAAAHVAIRDMGVGYLRAWDGTTDVEWRNITGRTFDVLSYSGSSFPPSSHVSVIGGTFGPCEAPRQSACTPRLIGDDLVADGVTIHGVTSTDLVRYHVDGMFIRGCNNCAVTRSKFYGNMITNIRVQNCCGLPPSQKLRLENNWFAASLDRDGLTPRADGVDIDSDVPGLVIQNNSFATNAGIAFGTPQSRAQVVGNLYRSFGCTAGVTYAFNLIIPFSSQTGGTPCSSSDHIVTTFGYADASAFDFHLAPKSRALRYVPAKACPSIDVDGQKRTHGRRCDAGSDQRMQTICHRVRIHPPRWLTRDVDPLRVPALRSRGDKLGACPKKRRG